MVSEDGGGGDLGSRILRNGSELAPRELVLLEEIRGTDEVEQVLQNEGIPQSLVTGVLVELFVDGLLSRQLVEEATALVVEDRDLTDPKEVSHSLLGGSEAVDDVREEVPVGLEQLAA